MLVLINSRMVIGSQETQTPSTVISVLKFRTAPANPEGSAIEADDADTRAEVGPLGSSKAEAV